jgi:glycosyltransferase involved in cell wall biosynthesis
MKKILLITRPLTPPWDEASKNFAFYLAKNIPDVQINILTHGILPDLPKNVRQWPIYTSPIFSLGQKLRLFFFLRKMRHAFDIAHYLFTPTKQSSFLIKNFFLSPQTKTIQTIATLRDDLYSEAEIKNLLFGDLLITYSDFAKNKLEKIGFKNVHRIYPGIDLDFYRSQEKNPACLQKYKLFANDFIINFTGEYTRLRAMNDVVQSFLEIAKTLSNVSLSLAVRIKNAKDARKKKEVLEIFEKNNLLDRVAFHDDGKYVMPDIYNLADISVFPVKNMHGKFDVPLAVIEAMACEKPVIISALPVLREFSNPENSVIIEPGNVSALTENILHLYQDQIKREALGKNARRYVENNFDIKKVATLYQEIYQKL